MEAFLSGANVNRRSYALAPVIFRAYYAFAKRSLLVLKAAAPVRRTGASGFHEAKG